MINGPEETLVEALKKVDVHGDVAPPHVHDPMTMRGTGFGRIAVRIGSFTSAPIKIPLP